MRFKKFLSMILCLAMLTGTLAGCGGETPSVSESSTPATSPTVTPESEPTPTPEPTPEPAPEPSTAATVLTAEKDAELQAALQARIDTILSTDTEIVHSDTYIPGETYTGTAYYVSNDGDDNNDGLTPETAWRTVNKVTWEAGESDQHGEKGNLQPGDAVFFRRGDTFRIPEFGQLKFRIDGLTFSAYGEGEKPIITGSSENAVGAEKWSLVYEDDSGVKIWKFYRDIRDVSFAVLNDGEAFTKRVYEYYTENGYVSCEDLNWSMHELPGVTIFDELFPIEKAMTENLNLISRPERFSTETNYVDSGVGPLYLRCDEGNPGELYSSIEFSEYDLAGLVQFEGSNTVFDNISFRCCGTAWMKNGISWGDIDTIVNTLIQNCEFAYCGGSVSFYTGHEDGLHDVGAQGDGIYGIVRNTRIRNNYFHDSCSTAMTYEADLAFTDHSSGYFEFLDNAIVNTMGIRPDSTSERLRYLDSVIIRGNYVWNTGRMDVGKIYYSEGAIIGFPNNYGECIIEENILYTTEQGHKMNALLDLFMYDHELFGYLRPTIRNNVYVQYADRNFADFIYHGGEAWRMDAPDLLTKAAELLGDSTSEFYIIEHND